MLLARENGKERTTPHNQVPDALKVQAASDSVKNLSGRHNLRTMNIKTESPQFVIQLFDLCFDRLQDIWSI